MSYVGTKTKNDWALIRAGYQETVDFIHAHNPRQKFFLTGIKFKPLSAEYVLARARKRPVRQEVLDKFEDGLREGKIAYMGAFSTVHLDTNGELVDIQHIYELLHAVINTRISAELNVHMGIPCGLINDIRVVREKSGTTPDKVEQPKIDPPPKEPEYEPPYSYKALGLIMAYNKDLLKRQLLEDKSKFTLKQIAKWCKENDSPLLEECMYNATLAKKSKFLTDAEWSALRYIFTLVSVEDSRAFFAMLNSYIRDIIELDDFHPITLVVNRFTNIVSSYNKPIERMAAVVIAWNAYRSKSSLVKLDWDSDKQEFPKAI